MTIAVRLRSLARTPAFSLAVIACWSLGFAAAVVTSSLADSYFVRPPRHVVDPTHVYRIYGRVEREHDETPSTATKFAYQTFTDVSEAQPTARFAAYITSMLPAAFAGADVELNVAAVSRGYFTTLGPRPAMGRFLDSTAAAPEVVLSQRAWQRYGGVFQDHTPKTIRISSRTFTVVGVAPQGFDAGEAPAVDAWVLLDDFADVLKGPDWRSNHMWWLSILVRLPPELNAHDYATPLSQLFTRSLGGGTSSSLKVALTLASLAPGASPNSTAVGRSVRLVAAAGFALLLIASLNVAGLFVLRASARQKDLAVRRALGASVASLVANSVIEMAMLAAASLIVALVLACIGGAWLTTVVLPGSDVGAMSLSPRMSVIALLCAAASVALSSLLCVSANTSVSVLSGIGSAHATDNVRQHRSRLVMLSLQTATSTFTVICAVILALNLRALRSLDLGLNISNVLLASVSRVDASSNPRGTRAALTNLADYARRSGQFDAVSLAATAPFQLSAGVAVNSPEHPGVWETKAGVPYLNAVEPEFFKVIEARPVLGRLLLPADTSVSERVAVVNETFARVAWPGGSPLGRCIILGAERQNGCFTVVGVIPDARRFTLVPEEPAMQVYISAAVNPFGHNEPLTAVLLRAKGSMSVAMASLRRYDRSSGAASGIRIKTFEDLVDPQIRPWRDASYIWLGFGVIALLLACIGTYSTLAYATTLRRREIAIRIVLGSRQKELFVAIGGRYIAAGIVGLLAGGGVAYLLRGHGFQFLGAVGPLAEPAVMGTLAVLAIPLLIAGAWPILRVDTSSLVASLNS